MISSLANGRVKHVVELREKARTRNKEGLFLVEGFKMFEEAPEELIKEVYIEESVYAKMKECPSSTPSHLLLQCFEKLQSLTQNGVIVEEVTSEVMRKISDTETPQGVLAVLSQMTYSLKDVMGGNILILEDIQDPGNLGTMVRTGEGAGISGIVMTKGCVDIFNPKTIRSTMGSLYRVPFVTVSDLKEAVEEMKKTGTKVYAAHLKGVHYYNDIHYGPSSAFMIGNEGNGLKDETAALADEFIIIPMDGKLESLNAAVAAALLMYEARK